MSRSRIVPPNELVDDWSVVHVPSAGSQATITKAAPGPGMRLVCTNITVTVAQANGDATAPTATGVVAVLIDGASGGTSYLWAAAFGVPAVAGFGNGACPQAPMWLEGTINTAMTLEFRTSGGAHTQMVVTMSGTTIRVI